MMKHTYRMLLVAFAGLLLFSCHTGKKNTPEAATEAFAKAFYTADFTHLYQYTTKRSHIVVQTLQNGMKGNETRLEEMKNSKVEFVETKILDQSDSTAVCDCHVTIDGNPRHDQWDLVKEDNEWKVTLIMP